MTPRPSPLRSAVWSGSLSGPAPEGFDAAALHSMESCAIEGDWTGYIALARQAGHLCPHSPPRASNARTADPAAGGLFDAWDFRSPLHRALRNAPDEASCDAIFSGLAPHLSPSARQGLLDHLLLSECDGMSMEAVGSLSMAPLLRAGASPELPAAAAARSGNAYALSVLLAHGASPDLRAPGHMPLILEALSKDRLYASADKMACAKILWERGALLEPIFSPRAGPSCLLDLAIAEVDPAWAPAQGWGGSPPWALFCFPWNYFDESGIPPWAVLPPESNRQANARIAALLDPAALGPAGPDSILDRARGRAHPFSPMPSAHPWLAAALEIAALRMSPPGLPGSRRPAL